MENSVHRLKNSLEKNWLSNNILQMFGKTHKAKQKIIPILNHTEVP